ncbi:hypothetical protein BRE01_55140 [Brevibacillus reuszeri]|uniref:Uncharacterized protein n=1 Tax=Brevibacillus reuszeri TaxID=54915 RepID=A0A0K9YP07_9BACL|nr:hypothetical protein [Brevibacillus reuszeri]KNB70406.1 hypothetical protein ADS79_15810 [Brevibacillus reuszeri]MED1857938.1 hypothetical protein [Brevibacillus reuszeri]GED71812.1 hypothetical protein BRE01_55140 [Brevibacillus reuszeri]
MRRKLNVFWFAILAVFVWSGLGVDSLAANQMPVQVQPTIEHMKVFRESVGTLDYEETWFNSTTGDWRSDLFSYNSKTPANGTFLRSIVTEKGYREYLLKTENGGFTGETWINREPNKRPYQSLFQDVAKEYKKSEWKSVGTVNFFGKQVKKLQRLSTDPKGYPLKYIVYLDLSTGLPMREEYYFNKDTSPWLISTYFFDKVIDPNGTIFKDVSGVTLREIESP